MGKNGHPPGNNGREEADVPPPKKKVNLRVFIALVEEGAATFTIPPNTELPKKQ